MKKFNKILALLILSIIISCDAILEEDISADSVITVSPYESEIIVSNVVSFQWQELDGADNYRLQVIKSGGYYSLDSLVTGTEFTYQLDPGFYSWRIKGENFGYSSEYSFPINFSVELSEDLSNQLVVLETPTDNYYSNNVDNLMLTWLELDSAITYDLEIVKTISGTETILQEYGLSEFSYTIPENILNDDALYTWKVRGVNNTSHTDFSQRNLYIDHVIPNQPQQDLPIDNADLSDLNINFSWNINPDSGTIQSPISFTIQIATDIGFNNLILTQETVQTFFQYSFSSYGDFYWRIYAKDQAGNTSAMSSTRKLTIN